MTITYPRIDRILTWRSLRRRNKKIQTGVRTSMVRTRSVYSNVITPETCIGINPAHMRRFLGSSHRFFSRIVVNCQMKLGLPHIASSCTGVGQHELYFKKYELGPVLIKHTMQENRPTMEYYDEIQFKEVCHMHLANGGLFSC